MSWREQPGRQDGRGTGDKRQGSPGVSPLRAAAFAAPFGRKPYGAARGRARLARHRPSRSLPSRPDAVPHEPGQAVTRAPSAPIAVRKVTATGPERRALSGSAPPPSRAPKILSNRSAKDLRDPPLRAGASADPAGLTARARPEARPEMRAANLCETMRFQA